MGFVSTRTLTGYGRLGDVCSTLANGSRVCGPTPAPSRTLNAAPRTFSSPVRIAPPVSGLRIGTPRPVMSPTRFPAPGVPQQPPYYSNSNPPYYGPVNFYGGQNQNQYTTAQLAQLAQTNPSALTAQQWAQLQAQGFLPSTLPSSSAPQLLTSGTAVPGSSSYCSLYPSDPSCAPGSAGYCATYPTDPSCASATASTTVGSVPIWVWGVIGILVLMFVMKQR